MTGAVWENGSTTSCSMARADPCPSRFRTLRSKTPRRQYLRIFVETVPNMVNCRKALPFGLFRIASTSISVGRSSISYARSVSLTCAMHRNEWRVKTTGADALPVSILVHTARKAALPDAVPRRWRCQRLIWDWKVGEKTVRSSRIAPCSSTGVIMRAITASNRSTTDTSTLQLVLRRTSRANNSGLPGHITCLFRERCVLDLDVASVSDYCLCRDISRSTCRPCVLREIHLFSASSA